MAISSLWRTNSATTFLYDKFCPGWSRCVHSAIDTRVSHSGLSPLFSLSGRRAFDLFLSGGHGVCKTDRDHPSQKRGLCDFWGARRVRRT